MEDKCYHELLVILYLQSYKVLTTAVYIQISVLTVTVVEYLLQLKFD